MPEIFLLRIEMSLIPDAEEFTSFILSKVKTKSGHMEK
jgi:hypothetical protein